ncbi:MAG: hypothetical protein ACRDWY_05910, partial [Actinomycetes bacterium]
PEKWFLRLLVWAFVLKLLSAMARYAMAFVAYDGIADSGMYDDEGERLAEAYREGDFTAEIGRPFIGTGFIRVLTGAVYAVTGPSIFVAYVLYALLSFWGVYFLYRAFQVAVPDGDRRRYALLVFLLPSMLFWPSSLGKEAWMTFGLGLTALGAAGLLADRRDCVWPLGLGLTATAVVRPHITATVFAAIAVAMLVRKAPRPATELTPIIRVVTLAALAACGLLIVSQAQQFLGIEQLTTTSVDAAIVDTAERTGKGGSSFESVGVNSPLDLPMAIVSVLFRPFLFEAGNPQMLLAAVEGTFLLLLVARSLPRLRSVPGRLRRNPFVTMCAIYSLLFIYAFSNFANFGLLARERVQVLPFALVLLCLPRRASRPQDESTSSTLGGQRA